jgi:DNA-binding HxlR family transcriptional regulator
VQIMEISKKNNFNPDNTEQSQHDVKRQNRKRSSAMAMTESIFACKWSAHLLPMIKRGVNRPGAMIRELDGLTTKVLNVCLRRLVIFGLLQRVTFNEIPPRVEYKLTTLGMKFTVILESIEKLQGEIDVKDVD